MKFIIVYRILLCNILLFPWCLFYNYMTLIGDLHLNWPDNFTIWPNGHCDTLISCYQNQYGWILQFDSQKGRCSMYHQREFVTDYHWLLNTHTRNVKFIFRLLAQIFEWRFSPWCKFGVKYFDFGWIYWAYFGYWRL